MSSLPLTLPMRKAEILQVSTSSRWRNYAEITRPEAARLSPSDGGGSRLLAKDPGLPDQNPLWTKETDSPDPVVTAQRCVLLHARAMMHKGERYLGAHKKINSHWTEELNTEYRRIKMLKTDFPFQTRWTKFTLHLKKPQNQDSLH